LGSAPDFGGILKYIANALGKTVQKTSNAPVSIKFDKSIFRSEREVSMLEF